MGYVTLTELRANMARYFDKLEQDSTELVVPRQNHEPVVIMPLAELEGLRETPYLLSSPANAERLCESIAELDGGKGLERSLIEE
jgi:antitoxin YefM